MNKIVMTAVLATTLTLGCSPVFSKEADANTTEQGAKIQPQMPMPMSQGNRLFEERAGTWKATCDRMEDSKVYCRMFHIERFGEWKTKNFVQMGPAWTPDSAGFVVATYLGFKEGTTVSIGIDKHSRHKLTAPKGNNLMLSPEGSEKILQEMENGHKLVITFNSYSGFRHLSLADLGPYKMLLAKVKQQMATNATNE